MLGTRDIRKWPLPGQGIQAVPYQRDTENVLIFNGAKGNTMINNMVLSSEIEWIGYEHKRNMLQVEFIAGPVYQYESVPEVVYKDFLTAPSHGRFFESNIKGKYQYRKVR